MRTLKFEEMESSFKIDLRDVSWWISIKDDYLMDDYRPGALVTIKLSKEGCISLVTRRKPSCVTHKHD
jgi:hypothetical protein